MSSSDRSEETDGFYARVNLDIERENYFLIMEACLILHQTMDQFIINAVKNYLEIMYLEPHQVFDHNPSEVRDHESFSEDRFTDDGNPHDYSNHPDTIVIN